MSSIFGLKGFGDSPPESIQSNNIVFHLEGNFGTLDQAKREARYIKRDGYYVRVAKKAGRYCVYAAQKR